MLPAAFQTPAAIILLLGGLLSCFAGYRVFRVVLGFFGFVLGALLASSLMGTEQTMYMIVAAIVGGIVGALILVAAYFVGVALIGAGVGALIVNVTGDSPAARAALEHDDVIVQIEGKEITSPTDVFGAVRRHRPGDVIDVVVVRGTERKTVKVTLASTAR